MNNKPFFGLALILLTPLFLMQPLQAQEVQDTLVIPQPVVTNVAELLVGREAGVEVVSSPGAPGMTPTIHVRGLGVLQGIPPVYVVDGMRRRDLAGIDPSLIEKVEVLRDAAAMGLWGPDAAAGVVVVTTKRASRKGIHAGYEFQGAVQQLTAIPARMTRADWMQPWDGENSSWFPESAYREPDEIPAPESSFLQHHRLFMQYGGEKLSAYAGLAMLDNDGPYAGRVDTERRWAASWQLSYTPLPWLSLETTGRWGKDAVSEPSSTWLNKWIVPVPVYKNYTPPEYHYKKTLALTETVVQGKVEVRPLPGLYARGLGGYSRRLGNDYEASWAKRSYTDDVFATAGYDNYKWYQWAVEAGWSAQWKGHRPHLDLSFRRIKEKRDYRILSGNTDLADIGLQFGDDDHLEERFLLPAYDRYLKAGGGIDGIIAANLNKIASATPESKWKEAVLSAGYDWKDRYRVDFSYMRMWEETLFSSEGYRIPAVTLGWTLSEEPLLRKVLPSWWTRWSAGATWSRTDPFIPLLDDISRWYGPDSAPLGMFTTGVSTAARHRDLSTSTSFQAGRTSLDMSVSWYVNDDDLTRYYAYFESGQNIETHTVTGDNLVYTIRNTGLEWTGNLRGRAGAFRYALSANLTYYHDLLTFGPQLKDVKSAGWRKGSPLLLRSGHSLAQGHFIQQTVPDGWQRYGLGDDKVRDWRLSPILSGGLRASLGWNRWQLTLAGHGNTGRTIRPTQKYCPLVRYYLENPEDQDRLVPRDDYLSTVINTERSFLSADFFRIDQLRLDYMLPVTKAQIGLYVSLENFFLLTKYRGSDPEMSLSWESLGVDTARHPATRRIVFGVKAGF